MRIRRSAEDYLEMILMLEERSSPVRSVDIAAGLKVSKPSVSVAMKALRENGYIVMTASNAILLTTLGRAVATRIYDRHKVITACLLRMGVPEEIARKDACKIEHDLSDETYEIILRHIKEEESRDQ